MQTGINTSDNIFQPFPVMNSKEEQKQCPQGQTGLVETFLRDCLLIHNAPSFNFNRILRKTVSTPNLWIWCTLSKLYSLKRITACFFAFLAISIPNYRLCHCLSQEFPKSSCTSRVRLIYYPSFAFFENCQEKDH